MPPRRRRQLMDAVEFDSSEQETRFNHFCTRAHLSTRWLNHVELEKFGFMNEIRRLASTINVQSLLTMSGSTYVALTCEFFSALTVTASPDSEGGHLEFRLGNRWRTLTLCQLNQIFHFPPEGRRSLLDSKEQDDFWYAISGNQKFHGQCSKASDIVNPCFWVLHRLLASTIYGRDEGGNVRCGELAILWAMVYKIPMDIGYQLAIKFKQIRNSTKGGIVVGGIITQIAALFEIDLSRYTETLDANRIDEDLLVKSSLVKHLRKKWYRVFKKKQIMRLLPDDARTPTDNEENWYASWIGKPLPPRNDEDDAESMDDSPVAPIAPPAPHFEQVGSSSHAMPHSEQLSPWEKSFDSRLARLEKMIGQIYHRTSDYHSDYLPSPPTS